MNRMLFLVLPSLAGLFAGFLSNAAQAADADGGWSLTVVTEKGSCDRGYRYPLMASGGSINYFGDADVEFTGTVSPAGDIKARFIKGTLVGNVTGKLGSNSGAGTWSGKGGAGACSGKWQAERR